MSNQAEQLRNQIKEQGTVVRELKASQAPEDQITAAVSQLQELKAQLSIETGAPAKKPTLKTPKGTRDYTAKEMSIRSQIFQTITDVFKRHGGVTIDTPVFELKEILTGKYGEDSKLIYDLQDQGGELCSLRYDLTVPFARFVAMNKVKNIKRYQIAKVYRRDQPAMTKGRMREFFQCDFDIAGTYDAMVPDAECIRVAVEVLSQLDVGAFIIKVNHRKLLDAVFEASGVPEDKVRTISSAVDKLDKLPWAEVKQEMLDKGLTSEVADQIGEYVQLQGGQELLAKLQALEPLMQTTKAQEGISEMKLFFEYADIYNVLDRIKFDMSLARGLDYYTGIIYEAVLVAEECKSGGEVRVGSIAAGGRYDTLVGMFGSPVPCVGISFGVERIFSIVMSRMRAQQIKSNHTQVYVIAVGGGLLKERMQIVTELWDNGIAAEFMYKAKAKLPSQFKACDDEQIPWAVIVGQSELDEGVVLIKNMLVKDEAQGNGIPVKRADMIAELKQRIGN
ncbi:Cytoplasmic and mitochondrial histidine tRNA synthetase [Coemansia sp. RSA 1085]|nr:histidyl-tRNA synthetase [Coemansia mojavensis]KAJ2673735.1 Cytoplasmic and mitochondrial histidine tRNA synthetase [Coemansia sp. RSA 1085]